MDIAADSFYRSRFSGVCPIIALSVAVHAAAIAWFDISPNLSTLNEINLGSISAPVSVAVSFAAAQKHMVYEEKRAEIAEPEAASQQVVKAEPVKVKKTAQVPLESASISEVAHKKQTKPEHTETKQATANEVVAKASTKQLAKVAGISDSEKIITKPVFRTQPPPPPYPALSVRRNQQGRVMVEVIINSAGDPVDAEVLESSGYTLLDQAALTWVAHLEFSSASVPDQATTAKVHIPVLFKLSNGRRG